METFADLEKLDKKDRKILVQLDANSRQPFSTIAKQVGLSKEAVKYRIERMQKQGFLGGFYAFSNLPKLGFSFYKVYFRFQFADPKKEKEIISYLINQDQVCWLVVCDGRYDLVINVLTNGVAELDEFLNDFRSNFGSYIQSLDVTTITNFFCCDRVYLTGQKLNSQKIAENNPTIALDEKDALCLDILSKNARTPLTEMSKKLGLSIEAVRKRVQRLVKNNVIQKFTIKFNYRRFNYQYFKVMIKFQNLTGEKRKQFIQYCVAHPHIVFIIEGIGASDVDIDLEIESLKKFHDVILELKYKFGHIIKDYEILLVAEELKAAYLSPIKHLLPARLKSMELK